LATFAIEVQVPSSQQALLGQHAPSGQQTVSGQHAPALQQFALLGELPALLNAKANPPNAKVTLRTMKNLFTIF